MAIKIARIWLFPKALKVFRHLLRQRQEPSIEPFDLIDRSSSVLCEVEDVHLPLTVAPSLQQLQ